MKIEWIMSDNGVTCTAKVTGGTLVKFENGDYNAGGSGAFYGCSMAFVPDARIALAGQIAAQLICKGYLIKEITESAFIAADEILRQAAESEAGK
jgi:hypothetical protein